MEQKLNSHIFKGCFIAILYTVFNTIITLAKLHNAPWTDFVAWFIIVVGTIISVHLFGKVNNNNQPFGALFSHGFKTTAVATCFIFVYVLLMLYVINSKQIFIEADQAAIEAKKHSIISTEKDIIDFKASFIKAKRLMSIAGTIMIILFLGVIGAVVGAVGTSKKNIQTN